MIGIVANPYAWNVPRHLRAAAVQGDLAHRMIDLTTLTVALGADGSAQVRDAAGTVLVDVLVPYLLYGFPAAMHALRLLARQARTQNPVDAVLLADDKAATAVRLADAGVAQLPTTICGQDAEQVAAVVGELGYPVVVKRTHGAQGRWVRRAFAEPQLRAVVDELATEGPGALVVQPYVAQAAGSAIRAIVTGGAFLVASQRFAPPGEWRSNIAGGGTQQPVELRPDEVELAVRATTALGLRHSGVDLLRTDRGTVVLEVNACPDFTSMLPHFARDLTAEVLQASLAAPPGED